MNRLWMRLLVGIMTLCSTGMGTAQEVAPSPNETKENGTLKATEEHAHTNRLAEETSPYLLQHAHNPVDWFPWGEEALAKSKSEDKPIFLSIGYSSCHWCHVMERESFENEEVAAVMNEFFVCIKVDREERPDLDDIYMSAVQAMTGSGGWPMSVWLTPDMKPFYGGTYFPPEDGFGKPGFKSLLKNIGEAWATRRGELVESADRMTEHITGLLGGQVGTAGKVSAGLIEQAIAQLGQSFDAQDGGFGGAPKFPSSPSIELLLRDYARTGNAKTLAMATTTLDKMAFGGIYDHIGGGFARYSTDEQWLVPHFEKMLYDNAQLAKAYLEAYQVTGSPRYRRVVEETFDYILRDMLDERGGFHSAEDADSEGEEGKFYVWTQQDVMALLGEEDGKLICDVYQIKAGGNFSSREHYHAGQNIFHMSGSLEDKAEEIGMTAEALLERLAALREKLLVERSMRVRPGLDDKVLTSWNSMMITAFATGYQVLGEERYLEASQNAAMFILNEMTSDGKLLRTHRKGESRLPAYLDDYAFMVLALMDVYESDFDPQWLREADALAKTMVEEFWDVEAGAFYFTSDDHKNLIVRTRPNYDGAEPSGNSMAAMCLLRLAKFTDNAEYYKMGERILETNQDSMSRAPRAFLKMMGALDFYLYPPKEIAIVGPAESEGVKELLSFVRKEFIPNKIVSYIDPANSKAKEIGEEFPLLAGKTLVGGKPAAYVCKNYACKLPVTSTEDLAEQLK